MGISVVEQLNRRPKAEWLFLVSPEIHGQLGDSLRKQSNVRMIDPSPARPLSGLKSRREMQYLEGIFKPDLVYSVGFPSYVKFIANELGRYTNPWEIFDEPLPWDTVNGICSKARLWALVRYRRFFAKRARFFETQTKAAQKAIALRFALREGNVFVLRNSIHPIFSEPVTRAEAKESRERSSVKILTVAADHPHKNLLIIPRVARALADKGLTSVKFCMTLPPGSRTLGSLRKLAAQLGVDHTIENLGPLTLRECLNAYQEADVLFLPTLLEVASATYLEAALQELVIVTPRLEFALEQCGPSGAAYYEPRSATDAAEAIINILQYPEYKVKIVREAKRMAMNYVTVDEKFDRLVDWLVTRTTLRDASAPQRRSDNFRLT